MRPDAPLAEAELLPPLAAPEKILCIGINYANRGQDYNLSENPKYPSMFYRAPNSLVGHGQNLIRPKVSEQLDYEGEIAHGDRPRVQARAEGARARSDRRPDAVQRRHGPRLAPPRPVQRHAGQELRLERQHRAVDRDRRGLTKPLHLVVRKNGEVTQDDTTANMVYSFADLIAYITTFMTLKPGDIVVTGTPVKKGREGRSAGLAQAGRYDRGRVPADRRAAQFRGGRGVSGANRAAPRPA